MIRIQPFWGPRPGMLTNPHQTVPVRNSRTDMEIGYGWRAGAVRSVLGVTKLSEGTLMRLGGELRPWDQFRVSLFGLAHVTTLGLNMQGSLRY